MKSPLPSENFMEELPESLCDFLILSDGTILSHNLTPQMAEALRVMNPADETLRQRAGGASSAVPSTIEPCRCP